jgi:hypothetical protein
MGNLAINLLKEFIGAQGVSLFSSHMIIVWGKSVIVPDFSVHCGKTWAIMEASYESFDNSDLGWHRLDIQPAHPVETPQDPNHFTISSRHKVVQLPLSSIDFLGPYAIESIEVHQYSMANSASESEIVAYDGCLVFNFDDGRQFAISAHQTPAPGGTLGFTMDEADINQLTSLSNRSMVIT